jgi:hypothetical protein
LLALVLSACGGGILSDDESIVEFPDEGRQHIAEGTPITYNTDPPTSGPHYPIPQEGGFYTREILPGYLVHTMEHGGIIIYYDPLTVTGNQQNEINTILQPHRGNFATVAAVPRDDPDHTIILTAWRHWQRLKTYDANKITDFIDLFLGHGPEN